MRKSIGLKIMVPFCILAIVCGLCSTLIYSKIAQMNQATKSISDNYMTITEKTGEMESDFILLQYKLARYVTAFDDDDLKQLSKDIKEATARMDKNISVIAEKSSDGGEADAVKDYKAAYATFSESYQKSKKAIDDYEGALSGSIITFLNKLAARFPDKEFSTLAYLYTMNPPKHVKPLPNVNIMLCDIDCDREVTLTENASGKEFVKAMEGWSKITNNIFVWDYGINFDNYLAPFPNFHILQDNIRLFKKNHATMHFSQIAGSRGGDFAELRAYLVSKLMWNPEVNVDSLMQHFLHGYYGEAAPYLYQYIKIMEGALIGSGQRLWIYDSPVSHKYGMLKPALMRRYNHLFDLAEKAVAAEPDFLKRVQRARLPIQYSELEIARTETEKDLVDINKKLDLFEERVKEFQVPTLNERSNSPVDYCKLYRERYMPQKERSLALGAKVTYLIPPTGKYAALGKNALVDGLFGGATFVDSWIGWEGTDGAFVIDLGETKEIQSVETDFLHQIGAWILFPLKVVYSYAEDGEHYTHWKTIDLPEERTGEVKFRGVKAESAEPIKTRYVKVEVTGTKECPTWHYGVGHPSWFFIDEVIIK